MAQGLSGAGAQRQENIEYKVIFTRRRSISLIVSPDKGVTVRAPYRTSLRSIERFVRDKEGWIRKHLEKHSELIRINHGKRFTEGETHLYLGTEYYLKILESHEPYVKHYDSFIEVGLNDTGNSLKIRSILMVWYRMRAREYLARRFEYLINSNLRYGFLPSDFVVKPLKSRWGSCTSKGRITISSELIKLDPVFAADVIIHELCHMRHQNHGKEFYKLLGEIVPDYKVIRKELKQYLTR